MAAVTTTRQVHRKRKAEAPALVRPARLVEIPPPDYRSGISLRDFAIAIAGRPGWVKFSFADARGGADYFVRVPDFNRYSHGTLVPDAEVDLLVSTAEPWLTMGVFPSPQGGVLQVTAIGCAVPLALSAHTATSAGPGVSAFSMGSQFQRPASEDQQRRAIAALVEHGAHLITHAGDRIVGTWRLSRSVSEGEGRMLSAAVARRVPGAQLVHDGVVHSTDAMATYGIPEPPPLTYPVPRPVPACRIIPRQEFVAWGLVSESVDPEVLK